MSQKSASLYRMVMPKHICPFGIKAKDLLQRKGYVVEDHRLTTREETDAFKREHGVETTPQAFIDGQRIGGYSELRAHFGMKPAKPEGTTYVPVIAVFATTFLMALALAYLFGSAALIIPQFIALSMCVLAVLKLRDLYAFSNQFITYDLLAMRWVPYAMVYPFVEAGAGILMLGRLLVPLAAIGALIIGTIGAVSIIKAVYMDKRELKCACVGGNSNVPLGFISLTENLMMMAMGGWMLLA